MSLDPISLFTIIGSVVGGIGQGMMEKSRLKAEEQARKDEEKRREERYKGIGDAMAFWEESEVDPEATIASPYTEPHKSPTTALGKPQPLPPSLGQKYKKKPPVPKGFSGMVST